jgi:hypothetical protein
MLSATGKIPQHTLVNEAHRVLRENSYDWPTSTREQAWYCPIAAFLNGCVGACHTAISSKTPAVGTETRWYDRLKFIVYDRTTVDGIDGASPVKPDLVGGLGLVDNERVAWSPHNLDTKQVLLPVEVKAEWAPVISQAATYARCLFSVSPSRQFAIVLGIRHTDATLRFLVFHRSGLTGSEPLTLEVTEGRKDILRIFLSILGWKSANDAGFLEFCNDFEMALPRHKCDEIGVVARVAEVLHDSLCVQGRASRALLMDYPTGKGDEPVPPTPVLDPTVRTRRRTGTKPRPKQGDEDTRTSFHHRCIQAAL